MAKKNQPVPKSFEEAVDELEKLLAEIEAGQLGLEETLVRYERGTFLIQHCRQILSSAEKQIEVISKAADGSLQARPMEAEEPQKEELAEKTQGEPPHPNPQFEIRNIMTTPHPALALLTQHGHSTENYLNAFLDRQTEAPPKLIEAIRYSLLAGGKRLRPTLILESAAATGRGINESALAAAGAMEMIHTFSLVHDDLPAMDNDDLRRGRPTNHKVFGEAMAILAGDGMVSLAFEMIAVAADPAIAPRLIAELARATGPQGMIGGQVLDMEGEGKSLSLDELKRLHRMKTGALLRASCRLGAIAAGASDAQLDGLTLFGQHLGLAFQIIDDVLDVTSTPEQMGKATNKDAARGKNTYPTLLGLENSRKEAQAQLAAALAALNPLGAPAQRLRDLASFVIERQN